MSDERIRILVIDDEVDMTETVKGVLESQGYEVMTANSGEHGLEIAYTEHPHLVLLDVMMPGMDGYQVCRELQFGYTKDIPVIFLTAKTELTHMMEASRSGASAFVTKPFRTEHLLQTVRDVLRDASVYYDEITGLPTLANVQVEVQHLLADHSQLGIIYISLEGIHTLEEQDGFEIVDDVFRIVGGRLSDSRGQMLRNEDFLSISSLGNAFLIVLSPSREQGYVSDADLLAIKTRIEDKLLVGIEDELKRRLEVKIGVFVGCGRLSQSPKVRFKRALLHAIDDAVNGIQRERSQTRHRLHAEFQKILSNEQVTCVYQPIVRVSDYAVVGYELLARGPLQSELHRPDVLFEVARDQGRVPELDRLCRMMAARASSTLPDQYLRFINTEPINLFFQARSDLFVHELVAATPAHLRGKTIIEVTEKSVIEDFQRVREVVARLREQGFRIAIDDAGAGYSGLQTVVEIEPDFMKLDMSLLRNIETSQVKQRLVSTLRDFSQGAGIDLVAEGVETIEQLEKVIELGVPYVQGFLFAHPGSPYPLQEFIQPPDSLRPAGQADAGDDASTTVSS
jgi:EAL domain-containing protein (putative c-di-GMP-specific phosphodiesterase class I)/CheY-like chemotaxis protein